VVVRTFNSSSVVTRVDVPVFLDAEAIDVLWSRFVGSRKLTAKAELVALWHLENDKVVSWKELYGLYYTSKAWKYLRWKVLLRDKGCVLCGSKLSLHVDHKQYRGIGKDRLVDLQVLCADCHSKKTLRHDLLAGKVSKSVNVVEEGELFMLTRGSV
jgi:5-methylcytosine-specific restriction endonuclease McrA